MLNKQRANVQHCIQGDRREQQYLKLETNAQAFSIVDHYVDAGWTRTNLNGTIISYLFKDTPEDVLRAGAVLAVERCVDEKITQVAIPVIFNTKDN